MHRRGKIPAGGTGSLKTDSYSSTFHPMNRFIRPGKGLLALLLSALLGCQSEFLDINTDPNNPSEADLNLLMPSAQAGYVNGFLANSNSAAAAFVDMIHSGTWGRWLQTNSDF